VCASCHVLDFYRWLPLASAPLQGASWWAQSPPPCCALHTLRLLEHRFVSTYAVQSGALHISELH
jgi:hypothetical protein